MPAATPVPTFDHIVVVMEESHSFNQIVGDTTDAPYINNTLIGGGALLSNYFAISHPSEPNYLAIYAGSDFGITDDNFHSSPDPTLDTVLASGGKSFTGFVENPDAKQAHNPWEFFPEGTGAESDFSNFPTTTAGFSSLPTVSFVIPNLQDDMHDGTIQQGDTWLQQNINAYAQWAVTHNSLLVVVWDEDDGTQHNQVPAIFYGANVNPGVYGTLYNHYDTLSTLVAGYGLTGPRNAAAAAPITDIFTTPCYHRGTLILTEHGEVPVEILIPGDQVVTLAGPMPIRWIGKRAYADRFILGNRKIMPIRFAAGALDDEVPARDLLVSPEHALFLDGVLVPAELLVNGATIVQLEHAERVEYFHIELDEHQIILAEGTSAETYVDCDNRLMFANGAAYAEIYPADERPHWSFCAERLERNSTKLTTIRTMLLQRAEALGYELESDPDLHLIVDGAIIRPHSISGMTYRFTVPASTQVWLASRNAAPVEVDPHSCDIRRLGVPIERLTLCDKDLSIEAWHSHAGLHDGFHDDETSHRWTNGLARLPKVWLRSFEKEFTVEVHLVDNGLGYRVSSWKGDRMTRSEAVA